MAVNRGGSQFADVSRYLTQNRQGADRMAGRVGGEVVNAGNNARADLANTQGNFNKQVAAGTPVAPPPATPAPATATPVAPAQAQVLKGRRGGGQQKRDPRIFNMLAQGGGAQMQQPLAPVAAPAPQYTGPDQLNQAQGFAGTEASIKSAQDAASGLRTGAGVNDALQGLYGAQRSGGVSALDNALLGRSGGILGGAADQNAGLGDSLQNSQKLAAARALAARESLAPAPAADQTAALDAPASVRASTKDKRGGKGREGRDKREQDRKMKALQYLIGQGV